jgi:hypothetical protein
MLRKYQSEIVLGVFALWAIGFAFQAGRSTQHQEDRKQIETAYKSSEAIQNHKRPNESNARPNDPTNSQVDNRSGEAPEVTFIWLKLGEGLLVFVTVWLVLVTKALVDGAKETAERQLRAYIVVRGKNLDEQGLDGPMMVQHLRFLNMGQTPAYRMKVVSRTDILDHPVKGDFNFTLVSGDNPSIIMVGPREKTIHLSRAERLYSIPELMKIRSEDSGVRLYTYGRIEYEDAFRVGRHTNFCFFSEWGPTKNDGTYIVSLQTSQHYNDAD